MDSTVAKPSEGRTPCSNERLADHSPAPNPGTRAPYNLSFTAASLRPDLARIVAEAYLAVQDWDLAKGRVLSSNALQCRTAGGAERQEREMRLRLKCLTHDQLMLLAHATAEDRAAIAWLAAVKHIGFAFEFAAEVFAANSGASSLPNREPHSKAHVGCC